VDVRIVVRHWMERGRFVRIHGFIQVLMPFFSIAVSRQCLCFEVILPWIPLPSVSLCCLELTNAHAVPHNICRRFLAPHVHEPMSVERRSERLAVFRIWGRRVLLVYP
jgi:hypothetical protein